MKPRSGRPSSVQGKCKEGIYKRNPKSAISVFSRSAYTHQRNFSIPSISMIKDSNCKLAGRLGMKGLPLLDQRTTISSRMSSKYHKNLIKIENYLEKEMIDNLKNAFSRSTNPQNGLTLHQFRKVIVDQLGISKPYNAAIDKLFTTINWRDEKYITWDLFCSYILVEFEKQELIHSEKREISFILPAKIRTISSRDGIINITSGIDGSFTTYSRDGIVTTWTSNLEIKKKKIVQTTRSSNRAVPKWVMCCGILSDFNKIIIGTGDRELQIIDFPSFESYCKIIELDLIPLCLETSSINRDECVITYGDKSGCISVLVVNNMGECLRLWKKYPVSDGFPCQTFTKLRQNPQITLFKWKTHSNWIQNMKYFPAENQVISCCNDDNRSVIIGFVVPKTNYLRTSYSIKLGANAVQQHFRAKDELVFNVYKGVKAFAFSKELNILITGGLDRQLRFWNPYVTHRPTGILRGHRNPIVFIHISAAEEQIYSISTEANVKIWDLKDHQCILSIGSRSHAIHGELIMCHYSQTTHTLMLCTDKVAVLHLHRNSKNKLKMPNYAVSHDKHVTSICYSAGGDVIASSSEDSIIYVWDIEEGIMISEIRHAHGRDIISSVCFDANGLRLISSGCDGNLKVWNYLNGQCLAIFGNRNNTKKSEFISCEYAKVGQNSFIIGANSENKLCIYTDDYDSNIIKTKDPMFVWKDPEGNGDISSIKYWNNYLATSSSSGQVVIWNMISGHIFSRLLPKNEEPSNDSEEWTLVRRITILHTRIQKKNSAMLVASGPYNKINFWNPYSSDVHASFGHPNKALITAICTNESDRILVSGDEEGFLHIWNIAGYAYNKCDNPPTHVNGWKGHSQCVTDVLYIDNSDLIVSSSANRTIKLWNLNGAYIGTFGQHIKWDIALPETYCHPNVEGDILTEPLDQVEPNLEKLDEIFSAARNNVETSKPVQINPTLPIGQVTMGEVTGKRLRRERQQMISKIHKIEGNEFHKLDIHSLSPY